MTQTKTFRVIGKDRLSDPWVVQDFATYLEAADWASRRAFVQASEDGRTVRELAPCR